MNIKLLRIDPDKDYLPSDIAAMKVIYNAKFNTHKRPVTLRQIQRLCASGVLPCETKVILKKTTYWVKGSDIIEYVKHHKRESHPVKKKLAKKLASAQPQLASL